MSRPAGIIDAHVHAYPAEVASDPTGWGRARGEDEWVHCVAPEGRRSLQGWADARTLIADMDQAGIERCILLGWYWKRQETCELQNSWYLAWARAHPDRLTGFATVQPAAGPRALEDLERALDSGLRGVGELLPRAQGFGIDDPVWRKIVEAAASRRAPITLHATDPQAGPAAGPPTSLHDYVRLAREHPQATFILAHWGGGLALREGVGPAGPLPPNLYVDTAASPLLYAPEVFVQAVARIGASRILFGSDYPLILYPRLSRTPGFERFLAQARACGLGAADEEAILGGNARRLLAPGGPGV